jgi:hypothetical protein
VIKFAAKTGDGKPLLFLGISGENVTRLAAGEPIVIAAGALAGLGLPEMAVVIHYGKTEQDILDEIRGHGITVETTSGRG